MLTLLTALVTLAAPTSVDELKVTLVKLAASEQRAAISRVVNGELQPLKGCYDLALKDSPDLKGDLELQLRLQAQAPSEIKVADSSTVKDATVVECVMARLRNATWPTTKPGASVTVRLRLAR